MYKRQPYESVYRDFAFVIDDEIPVDDLISVIKNIQKVKIITDRTKAIKYGLKLLKEDREESVLLLAGKGHESNQEIKRKTIHSNDHEIVRSFI